MPVPNTFANATASIPLSQLDQNFATAITLGNTAIQLGNTVSTLNNMTLANVTVSSGNVTATSVTISSQLLVPTGNTASRPASTTGSLRFNTQTVGFEGYNGSDWTSVGGGATGGGTDQIFYLNGQTVNNSYSIPSGQNAGSFGNITVASGATVTVPSGSTWTVV